MHTPSTRTFADRADALGFFFQRAGEAPRMIAFDDEAGCPLHHALAALEWTSAVGLLHDSDLLHAARLTGDTAAAMIERRRDGHRVFLYLGPRMDAPPVDPYEGAMLFDEPGVRAYEFAQRAHALAHFLRHTQGVGSVIAMLGRRAPDVRHVRRALAGIFRDAEGSDAPVSNLMLAGWFATSGGGVLFVPRVPGDPYVYREVGAEP